jgi:hypothetical protein
MVKILEDVSYTSLPRATIGPVQQVTCYSEYNDGISDYHSTATLRPFVMPQMLQDLSIGYEGWVAQHSARPAETKPFNSAQPMDNLVDACLESENAEIFLEADVVTKRGILFRCVLSLFRGTK